MSPLTSVFACPLGDDVPYDDSVRINLENEALLRSGWRIPSIGATNCYGRFQPPNTPRSNPT